MIRPEDYALTDEQLQTIFDRRIRRLLFRRAQTVEEPTAILLGGQPGAGKTRALQAVLAGTPGDPVAIIGDDLRLFHPDYARLLEEAPTQMADATAQASGRWVRMSIDFARDHNVSVAIEGTFRNPDLTIGEASRFHQAGYDTHLVALAVPGAVSRLSTLDRFIEDTRIGREARWTPLEGHQRGYEGTPLTVKAAEASPHVDRISVYNRDGQIIFTGERPTPTAHLSGAVQALEVGRATPQNPAAAAEWLDRFHDDVTYAGKHGLVNAEHRELFDALTIDAHQVADQAHPQPSSVSAIDAHRRIDQVDAQLTVYALAARDAELRGSERAEGRLHRIATTVSEPRNTVIPDLAARMRALVDERDTPTPNTQELASPKPVDVEHRPRL